ncbi:MAG: hypothetical protein HQK77_13730 [Desulfobacterales bacterium]|nr:hypothetical protein [Desulfobacterales bacterium]
MLRIHNYNPNYSYLRKIIIFVSIVYILGFSRAIPSYAIATKQMIYFYSSETTINNFKSLKMEFDTYLAKYGSYEFQPISDKEIFEKQIKDITNCFVILSSWHFDQIHEQYALKPSLVGIRDAKYFQRRVLVTSTKYKEFSDIDKGPIATASNIEHTQSVLKQMFPKTKSVDTIRILTVPKDIDALMSVGFEMAKAALVAETALKHLQKMDPHLFQRLKILVEGKPSLLLLLVVPQNLVMDMPKVIDVFQKMPNDPEGLNILNMLDLDGWKLINQFNELMIEPR